MTPTSTKRRLGIILLDVDGYSGVELSASPTDPAGLGVLPAGFLEHPGSWGCETVFRVAEGCTPDDSSAANDNAVQGLNKAAQALDGRVDLITTDCAYTSYAFGAFHDVETPVIPSSLEMLDFAQALRGDVAILSSSGRTLLGVMGEPPKDARIIDLAGKPEWDRFQVFTPDMPAINQQALAQQMLERLQEDFDENGVPGALILECTGLPQFRTAIRNVYSGPVIDVSSLAHYLLDLEQPAQAQFHVS